MTIQNLNFFLQDGIQQVQILNGLKNKMAASV